MSRITLHLKEQARYDAPIGFLRDDPEYDITFCRDGVFSDATTSTRTLSFTHSDYLTGGADIGVNYVRPPPLRRLSTIRSERSFSIGKRSPDNSDGSHVSLSRKSLGTSLG